MKSELLTYLACYECGSSLELSVSQRLDDEVVEGSLRCVGCQKIFLIQRGIPRFVPAELSASVKNTVTSFGWQWNTFDPSIQETHFDSAQVFLDFIAPVTEEFFSGKVVLDAGCGAGRFAKLAQQFGARQVIGVDLSSAVETAYTKTIDLPNVHIVQADIYHPPFRRSFDYIYSVGVLHHLPEPMKGFQSLLRFLKQDGSISIWVYGKENNGWLLKTIDPFRRHVSSRLPSPVLSGLSHLITIGMYPVLKLVYKPVNNSKKLAGLKKILFCNEYFSYLARFNYLSIRTVIFDHLTPQLAYYISHDELAHWFNSRSFANVTLTSKNRNSWRGFGDGYQGRISCQT
jgi:SAM-dependent methyltransferase